jgi:septum formation protein
MKIILASQSPRRLELLKALGHEILVIKPDIEEIDESPDKNIYTIASINAKLKAEYIYNNHNLGDADIILAADTLVIYNHKIYAKPDSIEHAHAMLTELSGHTHQVITAYFIRGALAWRESYVLSLVTMRTLNKDEIKAYVACGESLDKSGAYAVQGAGAALIDTIEGSITNIIGLPVKEVLHDAHALLSAKI